MTTTAVGWLAFVAALGMMLSLLAGDVAHLDKWKDALDPAFIAGVMTHLGAVVAAFVGGKLLPGPVQQQFVDLGKVGKP